MRDIDVLVRMEEAATTLKRMPGIKRPSGHRSHWPEWLRDAHLAYGYDAAQEDLDAKSRIHPTPEQIDRMDEAVPWLQHVSIDEGRAIWARANGATWRRCARLFGASDPRTGQKRVMDACMVISQCVTRAA